MQNCFSKIDTELFLNTISLDIVEKVNDKLIIIHAEAGEVIWRWVDNINMWCHTGHGGLGL